MICPKCGDKIKVIDSVKNTDDDEIYRKKKCTACGHIFYTIEYPVIRDEAFKKTWNKYSRY